ncbi:MAG: type VI secretion system baseplate subunit TssE [Planctomycetes bacterium]|nr:type VI secretion system baseplate subunit TssE [Planctomycetota bacterium]
MFQHKTLFERLRRPDGDAARSTREDHTALLASIVRNLERILNTRSGQAPAQMDFGIPPPSEIAQGYPESIGQIQKAVRQCIEKYEPRLRDVQIMQLESDDNRLAVRFQVSGTLATATDQRQIRFDTLIDPSGHIEMTA